MVSIVLFSVGGLFALYEAFHKFQHPEPIEGRWWWVPLVVLVVSIGMEGYSFRTAIHESNHVRGSRSWGAVHPQRQGARAARSSCSRTSPR